MRTIAVEALHGDEAAEPPTTLLQQPQDTKGMADRDGIRGPVSGFVRDSREEAEVCQRDVSIWEPRDERRPERGIEPPAVHQDKMHVRRTPPWRRPAQTRRGRT